MPTLEVGERVVAELTHEEALWQIRQWRRYHITLTTHRLHFWEKRIRTIQQWTVRLGEIERIKQEGRLDYGFLLVMPFAALASLFAAMHGLSRSLGSTQSPDPWVAPVILASAIAAGTLFYFVGWTRWILCRSTRGKFEIDVLRIPHFRLHQFLGAVELQCRKTAVSANAHGRVAT